MGQRLKVSSFCARAEQKLLSAVWLLKDACKIFQEELWADKHPEPGILVLRKEAGHTSCFTSKTGNIEGLCFKHHHPPLLLVIQAPSPQPLPPVISWWSRQKAPSSSCFQGKHIWLEGSRRCFPSRMYRKSGKPLNLAGTCIMHLLWPLIRMHSCFVLGSGTEDLVLTVALPLTTSMALSTLFNLFGTNFPFCVLG